VDSGLSCDRENLASPVHTVAAKPPPRSPTLPLGRRRPNFKLPDSEPGGPAEARDQPELGWRARQWETAAAGGEPARASVEPD
jgi:hypothetical protein